VGKKNIIKKKAAKEGRITRRTQKDGEGVSF